MALPEDEDETDMGGKVYHLTGAEGRAILAAAEKAVVKGELAYNEAAKAREQSSEASVAAAKAERGAWAAHSAAERFRRENNEAHKELKESIKSLTESVSTLSSRTANEVIRLTAEQKTLAERQQRDAMASHPALEKLRDTGLALADAAAKREALQVAQLSLEIEDETTAVKERKALAEDKTEARRTLIKWATRAGLFLGPLAASVITALVMRHCQ